MNELYVQLLHTDTVSVKRAAEGKFISGHYKKGAVALIEDISGSVQPTSGQDLEKLPEYAKDRQSFRFFSEDFDFLRADIILWEEQEYEILHLEPWNHYGLMTDHSYAIGVLVDNRKEAS